MPALLGARDGQASASTSLVITDPAPTIAPAPIVTGATSALFEPMKAPAPIDGAIFEEAVVIAGDRARADIGARADVGVADVGQMVGLGARARASPS